MKYTIQRLDGRHSYNTTFQYYVGFKGSMMSDRTPEKFNDALQWFTQTYGWSAEVRQYMQISQYYITTNTFAGQLRQKFKNHPLAIPSKKDIPSMCNPHWSWTNGLEDLRIYVASNQELTFFQLAFPQDSI